MIATGYNQVLVMIDHFKKYREAAPCMTASEEETCDHLIIVWIARHGYPITFQSDNGKAIVGDLTNELMKRSQVAQAHSTTYHPQTNGLVERQNRTLVSIWEFIAHATWMTRIDTCRKLWALTTAESIPTRE